MPAIVILFTRFGPYHMARIAATARFAAATGDEIIGMEITRTDHAYAWGPVDDTPAFRRVTLFPDTGYESLSPAQITAALQQALDTIAPRAVALPGWSFPESLAGLRWCHRTGAIPILMSESARGDASRSIMREFVKRCLVRHFAAALVGGSRHAAYAAALGLAASSIHLGYDVVDNDYFSEGATQARAQAPALRAQYRLPERYILASCRFIPKKNLDRLLTAFAAFHEKPAAANWHLVLCGDGELRQSLEHQAASLGIAAFTHFPGFTSYRDLPIYYGLASLFVHASTVEQWGLVVNEAMAAALPVLVSERCGCVPELVHNGKNGFTFNPENIGDLTARLTHMTTSPAHLSSMGAASRDIIRPWSPDRFAAGLMAARDAARQTPARPTILARTVFSLVK